MPALKLLAKLIVYYAGLAAVTAFLLWLFPSLHGELPLGRVQTLIAQTDGLVAGNQMALSLANVPSFGGSIIWLGAAICGSLLASLPVSYVYMHVRNPDDYDQSLIDTIVMLPLVVTSIVVVVQHSLALSFSLAGIAGAARYRNTLKSSGDLLFILLSIGIGLSAGIGAVELALMSSAAFNFGFVALWFTNFGERRDMKRYLDSFAHTGAPAGKHEHAQSSVAIVAAAAAQVKADDPAAPTVAPDEPPAGPSDDKRSG